MTKKQTQLAICFIKQYFQKELCDALNLMPVVSPLIINSNSGLSDDLGWDNSKTPVNFNIKPKLQAQVIQAATKWKRTALKQFDLINGEGILVDMRAIRKDEDLDHTHSAYVDQWDWEMVINESQYNLNYLFYAVKQIWQAMKNAEQSLLSHDLQLTKKLFGDVHFISSADLYNLYPNLSVEERTDEVCKSYPAVFIYSIGHKLPDGKFHELRAADYDNWELNGDLVVWNQALNKSLELSSMGIRVNAKILKEQLKITNEWETKKKLPYHRQILDKNLPLSIGGGIGQSRLFMFLLEKQHIGEVQASIWPKSVISENDNIIT